MRNFTIDNETANIAVHGSVKEAEAVPNSERFATEAALAKLAANWPTARLVDIWNGLPGETPVRKFKDRVTAVSRIWKALQSLGQVAPIAVEESAPVPEAAQVLEQEADEATQGEAVVAEPTEPASVPTTVAPQALDVAPEAAPARKKATRVKKAPVDATTPGVPREGSKTSQVIAMLKREGGTTLEEIVSATDWQKHTARAMLSAGGALTKKHGLVVASEKVGDKRVYSIKP